MKRETVVIFVIFGVFLVSPARNFGQTSSPDNSESTKDKVEQEAKKTKNYAYAKKDEFISSMKLHLAKLNHRLDMLGNRIKQSGSKTKAEADPEYDALRKKVAHFGQQLDDAKKATRSTWENVKADSQTSYQNLKEEIRREHKKLKEHL